MHTPDEFGLQEEENVIVHRKGPHKKQIIINEEESDVKTIRKKIDKDTEIIIIKKIVKK
ncbi:MAG: hypothetical protein HC830_14835 [Bacteroidetes bacterium]|nr:hypothetical protein [Bacteroidota bacterium]